MPALDHNFYIDGWLIEPRLNRMTGRGRTVLIEPKVMQVLVCLAMQPGEVIDRDVLLDRVWGDTIVTDHVLTRSISELRKVFEDDSRRPAFIETIPKTGYRLIAPLQVATRRRSDEAAPDDSYPGDSAPPRVGAISITPAFPATVAPASRPAYARRGALAVLAVAAFAGVAWVFLRAAAQPVVPLPTQPLTSLPGIELAPAFHGRHLAFTWFSEDRARAGLYVRLLGNETLLPLGEDSAGFYEPAWSPDGSHVAFRRYEKDRCGIYILSALGGPEREVSDCRASRFGLAWSPDGQWLAVNALDTTAYPAGLALLHVDTKERRPLTRPDRPYQFDHTPAFSPDGRRLAFLRSISPTMGDVYVVSRDGTTPPQRLTFDNRHVAGLTWAADGRSLIFSSNREGNYKLWRIPASGGEPVWLAAIGAYDPGGVAVSTAGDYLVYEEWDYEINVWRVPLAASDTAAPAQRVIASTRWDYHPQLSPDGQRLAFASNRTGSFELWIGGADGAPPMRLTDFDGPFVGMPRWTPDGEQLAFDARTDDGYAAVYTIDADGGLPRRRTHDRSNNLAPSWSRDGRRLYFASDRSGAWQIWTIPAAGGHAVQVTRDGGYLAFETPDGRALYVSKYGVAGLWRVPLDGGPDVQITEALSVTNWGNWTAGPDGIYFVEQTAAAALLKRFDPAAETVQTLRRLDPIPLSHEPGLTVSPDGRWLFYARADRVESDLVLVERFR